jgi:amino acid transporter
MTNKISLFSLVLLIVAAIVSIRNLPAVALFGSSLIFFYLFAALIFLIPISLVAAELAARFPEEGGVFHWVRRAFGPRWAFLAIWLQWINTMVWYPTILSFLAGTFAYLFDPALAQNKWFLASTVLGTFWGLTFLNLRGLHFSAKVGAWCGLIGTLLPMGFLIALGAIWWLSGHPIAMEWHSFFPSFSDQNHWVSLVAIMASFLGMELAGVHVNDIRDPQVNFPKAMGLSALVLLTTLILGSLAIAAVTPASQIRLVDGIMQSFHHFLDAFGLAAWVPVLALLIVIGTIGGMINWLISPAKGLLHAAEYHLLPSFFAKTNQQGIPSRILLAQAVLVSLFCLGLLFLPSINAFYWFLTDLSTELYMIMYLLLFAAAIRLGKPTKEHVNFRIPSLLRLPVQVLGILAALLTIGVGYIAPEEVKVGSPLQYAMLVLIGNFVLIAPAYFWASSQQR